MNKNRNLAVVKHALMDSLAKEPLSEEMTIELGNPKREIKGLYFDGIRPYKIQEKYGDDVKALLNMYQCRASDEDPMGAPVSIASKDKQIVVNFAGTFLTIVPIQKLENDEVEIVDYSYE